MMHFTRKTTDGMYSQWFPPRGEVGLCTVEVAMCCHCVTCATLFTDAFWSVAAACAGSRGSREASVLLLPGSLLVFDDEAYTACLHGIDQVCNSPPTCAGHVSPLASSLFSAKVLLTPLLLCCQSYSTIGSIVCYVLLHVTAYKSCQ